MCNFSLLGDDEEVTILFWWFNPSPVGFFLCAYRSTRIELCGKQHK
jgi:hypothetical protein